MFWGIVRRSAGLGLKAGALLGVLYFPISWMMLVPVLARIQTGHFHPGRPGAFTTSGLSLGYLPILSLLAGALSGAVLGALNGLFIAALTSRRPPAYFPQRTGSIAAACAAVSLCVVSGGLALMLGAVNYSSATASVFDWILLLFCIILPALMAAGAALWGTARLADWYQDETASPQNVGGPRSFFSDI